MKWIHLLFTSLLFLCAPSIASGVGFTQVTLTDNPNRPLNTAIWYPTQDVSDTTLIGDNPAFVGTQVIKDAEIQSGTFPVVLLSHGYRGNWRNQNWLATELASRGYIVAATDHPSGNHLFRPISRASRQVVGKAARYHSNHRLPVKRSSMEANC